MLPYHTTCWGWTLRGDLSPPKKGTLHPWGWGIRRRFTGPFLSISFKCCIREWTHLLRWKLQLPGCTSGTLRSTPPPELPQSPARWPLSHPGRKRAGHALSTHCGSYQLAHPVGTQRHTETCCRPLSKCVCPPHMPAHTSVQKHTGPWRQQHNPK